MAQPSEFQIERSETVGAPAVDVLPWIEDLHRWQSWSPWEGLDPNLEREYSGAPSGPGATYAWKGNRKAGAGRMEILGTTESSVTMSLEFQKPMKASNTVVFDLAEQDGTTTVTWTMTGPKTLMGRVFGLVFNMDKLIGKDFEKGLAALKDRAEVGPAPAP